MGFEFGFVLFAPIGSAIALLFALYLTLSVMKRPEGSEEMKKISGAVREGAKAYIKRQYTVVAVFFAVMFVILIALSLKGYLSKFVPFAFLTGGFFSALSGYIGMTVATKSNARTAEAAKTSLNSGLRVAFSAGAVMGLVVVGLGLLDLSLWFFGLNWYYRDIEINARIALITSAMLCFGMGASSIALFARVGGGIFTKAADVGSDLVGKVEAGIPEDDPRNAAVIADQVGDNVGDVAGMGADLYESYVGSIVATMALAVAAGLYMKGVTVPLVIASVGIVSSILGTFLVRTGERADQGALLLALRKGIYFSAALIAVFSFLAVYYTLGMEHIGVYYAVLAGLISGIVIGVSTEYYTSDKYKPTRSISYASQTGHATTIIAGLSVGMQSTLLPVVAVGVAMLASYFLAGGGDHPQIGLYGVGISAVGMLSTLGITLATDSYGPVADNAGGIAQMAHLDPKVRERTDALDALGNTTAATGKGFAIGSAALTALALIAAYREKVVAMTNIDLPMDIMNPRLFAGLFIGGMFPFLFCSMTMSAVGRAAGKIVVEVRRQFKEIPGLMDGSAKPDYAKAVDICTKAAQKEMVLPALMAIIGPIIVGLLLGVEGVVGLLAGSLTTGFLLALMMANSGGAWDNAKKYIEKGNLGGKGSNVHKAAITGDTVGDPFKDTSGPSLNILIKLMSMVSIVFASFIVAWHIW